MQPFRGVERHQLGLAASEEPLELGCPVDGEVLTSVDLRIVAGEENILAQEPRANSKNEARGREPAQGHASDSIPIASRAASVGLSIGIWRVGNEGSKGRSGGPGSIGSLKTHAVFSLSHNTGVVFAEEVYYALFTPL